MTWDGYGKHEKPGPTWYFKLERFIVSNMFWWIVLAYFLFFFVWPLTQGPEPVDIPGYYFP